MNRYHLNKFPFRHTLNILGAQNTHLISVHRRCVATKELHPTVVPESYVKKFMNAIGWLDQSQTKLKLSGYFLYESVPDKVVYVDWFKMCNLPDTFASWFVVTELHVWLLMVRSMAEDAHLEAGNKNRNKGNGITLRNCIVEGLWADVANRIKLLQGANASLAKQQVNDLSEQFQAALVSYDEGINDDRVMAAAIWRRFYAMSHEASAEHIELIVKFIRRQMMDLDNIASEQLKTKPEVTWLSISKE